MRVVPVCAVVLLTAGVTPLVAQNPAESPVPARLSLDEALARAAATSHRLAELRARESAAAAVLDQRKTADLPTIALQAGYQRTNHVDEFKVLQPDRSFQTLYPDVPDNWRTRVDLQWPIYTGGRDNALERAADAERQASGRDVNSTRSDLRLEATRAFWALVTATEAERVVRESVTRIEAQLHSGRDLVDVLPARTRGAHEHLLQFARIDVDGGGHMQHGPGASGWFVLSGGYPSTRNSGRRQ